MAVLTGLFSSPGLHFAPSGSLCVRRLFRLRNSVSNQGAPFRVPPPPFHTPGRLASLTPEGLPIRGGEGRKRGRCPLAVWTTCPIAPCQIHPCKPELARKGSWLRGLPSEGAGGPGQGRGSPFCSSAQRLRRRGARSPGRRTARRCWPWGWGHAESSFLVSPDRGKHHGGSGCWAY